MLLLDVSSPEPAVNTMSSVTCVHGSLSLRTVVTAGQQEEEGEAEERRACGCNGTDHAMPHLDGKRKNGLLLKRTFLSCHSDANTIVSC